MKNKGKMRILALVLCMVVMLSNSSFIFASGETETAAAAPETTAVTPEPEVSAASELAELPTPEPTAEPTEAPTPEPTEEPTPEASAAPEPTEVPTPEASAAPEPTAEPTPEASAAPEPTEVPTPEASAVPEPTAEPTPEASATPEPTEVPTPEASASPTPAAEQDIGSEESAAVTPTPEAEPEPDDSSEEIVLEGSCGDTTVILSGPASSFPEGTELSILVQEPAEEDQEVIEEAVEKQAEEQEMEVKSYTALDIRLLSNGEEIQPLGPVQVVFEKPETETAVQSEEQVETKVFHVDEQTGDAEDMKAEQPEEGQVSIETTHFSIYVVVNMDQLGGQIKLTVEHYATNVKALKDTGSTPQGSNTGLQDIGGGNWVPQYTVQSGETQIYTSDEIMLDNGLRTPIENLSKICMSNVGKTNINYELSKIRVNGTDYDVNSDQTITLKGDTTVRMIYTPKSSGTNVTLQTPVQFYDYDVTNGEVGNATLGGKYNSGGYGIVTDKRGINNDANLLNQSIQELTNSRLKFGFRSNGFFHTSAAESGSYGDFLNTTNSRDGFAVKTGIVKSNLNGNGNIQYSDGITGPALFDDGNAAGKTAVNGYQLGFIQEGDTYTLSQVYKNGNSVLGNLQNIRNIQGDIYANNFWPLDQDKHTDPLFGGGNVAGWYGIAILGDGTWFANRKVVNTQARDSAIGYSDDKKAHNWYFGMEYEFTFTLGDYTGPLNFYFRGDDDFWLFVDGEKKIDLGGIHSSVGQYLDLNYLKQQNPDKEHTIKIYYLERGGYGSSCYMQFTLPNVKPVNFDTNVPKTSVTVNKVWKDHNNPNRPSSVNVTLQFKRSNEPDTAYQDYETVSLSAGKNWTHTWTNMPKNGYTYRVVEKKVPSGYKLSYQQSGGVLQQVNGAYSGTVINTANPSTWINVTKNWDDGGASEYRPDKVQFQLYYKENGQWQIYPGGLLELTAVNSWKGTYENLPVYVGTTDEKMVYSVREVYNNADLKPGDKLPGQNEAQYIVSYPEGYYANDQWKDYEAVADKATLELTVTNTYGQKIQVTKDWRGTTDPELTVYVGLYKSETPTGKYVALNKSNLFTDVFEHLTPASDYSVKELKPADGEKGEFLVDVGDGKTVSYIGIKEGEKTLIGEYEYIVDYGEFIKDSSDASLSTVTITNQAQWQLIKYSSSDENKQLVLEGAEFELKGPNETTYTGVSGLDGIVTWKTSDGDAFTEPFPDGQYTLTETKAPEGYALGNSITFTMKDGVPEKMGADTGTVVDGIITFYYDNTAIYALPSSGGSGIYKYLFGGVLLMMAASLIVYKNKRREVLEGK